MRVSAYGTILFGDEQTVVEALWYLNPYKTGSFTSIFADENIQGSVVLLSNELSVENMARIGVYADAYAICAAETCPQEWALHWIALLDREEGATIVHTERKPGHDQPMGLGDVWPT